jgi:hypothetical protein
MKVTVAILIVVIVLYFEDQADHGGYYTQQLVQMIRAIGASFGFYF